MIRIHVTRTIYQIQHGMGAVMLQPDEEENRRPVGYWSKGLTATEREYAPTEIECKALHDCLMYWDVYVRGALEVDVYTNHNCLMSNSCFLHHYFMAAPLI